MQSHKRAQKSDQWKKQIDNIKSNYKSYEMSKQLESESNKSNMVN